VKKQTVGGVQWRGTIITATLLGKIQRTEKWRTISLNTVATRMGKKGPDLETRPEGCSKEETESVRVGRS